MGKIFLLICINSFSSLLQPQLSRSSLIQSAIVQVAHNTYTQTPRQLPTQWTMVFQTSVWTEISKETLKTWLLLRALLATTGSELIRTNTRTQPRRSCTTLTRSSMETWLMLKRILQTLKRSSSTSMNLHEHQIPVIQMIIQRDRDSVNGSEQDCDLLRIL